MSDDDYRFTLDLDQLTIDDLPLLDKLGKGIATADERLDFFDRVVVGGIRGKKYPFRVYHQLVMQIWRAILDVITAPDNAGENPGADSAASPGAELPAA